MGNQDFHGTISVQDGTASGHATNKGQLDAVLAQAIARSNHTGTSTMASTISDAASYVDGRVALVIDSAPSTLNTLNELAAALGDDPNYATTVTGLIGALDTRIDTLEALPAGAASHKATFGNGSLTSHTITHNLGTVDVIVQVVRVSDGATVWPTATRTTNTVVLDFGTFAPTTNSMRVLIQEVP